MAVRTALGRAELEAALAPFGLGALRAFAGLAAGSINTNYVVDTARGRFFVRLFEDKSADDVAYELALLVHLGARGVPVVVPLAAADGARCTACAGRALAVFPFVDGVESGGDDGETPPGAARARRLGEALARLHVAGADFPRRRAGAYTRARVAERLPALRAAAARDPDVAAALTDVEDEHAFLAVRLDALALPEGVIHGDLFPDNVLWRAAPGGGAGEDILALLDFEMAATGPFVRDLATLQLSWCFDAARGALAEADMAAMAAAYGAVRPLEPRERVPGLWLWSRFVAWRYTVSRLTDFHLSPLPPDRLRRKDFRRYLARLRALRALDANAWAARAAPAG
ncbi:MAG TPA: homoserine kinase [Myxococcota bacterium]|jgi:homoserine kinase type II|nr:homoserine kinase [Myxococcota bacterium]